MQQQTQQMRKSQVAQQHSLFMPLQSVIILAPVVASKDISHTQQRPSQAQSQVHLIPHITHFSL